MTKDTNLGGGKIYFSKNVWEDKKSKGGLPFLDYITFIEFLLISFLKIFLF